MKKSSYKVLWNVFLFVICGGSLIYGSVQQRRMVESKVEMVKYRQRADSLKMELDQKKSELERMNAQLQTTLLQLQIERDKSFRSSGEAKRK